MFHHTPLEADKENQHSQGPIKHVSRCKTPHCKPLGLVNSASTFTPTSAVLTSKQLSTNYQKSHSPGCFTPLRSLKKQKRPKTPHIPDEKTPLEQKQGQSSSNDASLKLTEKLNRIAAEKQELTSRRTISGEVSNVSSSIGNDEVAEYVNAIIQKQLSILQDEVKCNRKEESITESNECGEREWRETFITGPVQGPLSQIGSTNDDTDSTIPLLENDADQMDNCDAGFGSMTKESLGSSVSFQSTSLNAFDVSCRSFSASPQWQIDNCGMITTRDTGLADCLPSFQAAFSPVEMRDAFSQISKRHQINPDSPVDCDRDFSWKRKTTMKTPPHTAELAVNTTPVKLVNGSSHMTPVSSKEEGTAITPRPEIFLADSSTSVTPKNLIDGISQMTPKSWQEQETCTSPVAQVLMVDEAVYTTPVAMKSMASGMTPCSFKDQSTAITPHQASDATTCTSPLANINLTFEPDGTQKDHVLVSQLETAAICNEILRQDIHSLESKMDGMRTRVKEKEQEVAQVTNNLFEKEQHFKTLHQNEIDELQIQIEKQVNQIGLLEHTLSQKSNDINTLEADISCVKAHYQKQIQNLQQDLCRAYRQHKKEAESMKEEIDQNATLKEELQAATEHVEELQENLKTFSQLKGALEEGDEVQDEMESLNDYYAGLEVLVRQMEDECKKYKEENLMMKVKMEENDAQTNTALDKASESSELVCELKMELDLTKAERSQLDELYSKASLELGVATHQYAEFLAELENTKFELEKCKDTVRSLEDHQNLQDQKAVESCLQEMCLEASLIVQTDQTRRQQAQNEAVIAELQADNERLNRECSELQSAHGVETQRLQSKVDDLTRENDQSRKRIADQFQEIRANFHVKSQLYQAKQSIHKMEEKHQESQEFIEEECTALNETLKEKEAECQAVVLELSRYKVALYSKLEEMEELQEGIVMLRRQLMDCESELDNTKANAHLMLLNQLSEMADASKEIANLQSHMVTAFNSIVVTQQPQNDQNSSTERTDEFHSKVETSDMQQQTCGAEYPGAAKSHGTELPSKASLVASILHAINGSEEESAEQSLCGSKSANGDGSEKSPVLGSNCSAFTAVKPEVIQGSEANTTHDADCQNTSATQKKSLGDSVRAASGLFEELLEAMKDNEMELTNKNEDISNERQIMETSLKKTITYYDNEIEQMKERLLESECRERRLHQKLQSKMSELTSQNSMMQYGQQQLDAMATKLDSLSDLQFENKHLKEETDKLQNTLKGSNMQRELLEKELTQIVQRLEEAAGMQGQSGLDVTKVMQENIALKKEMEKLKLYMMEKNDYYENLNSRASRQMKTLKENWKKAEDEIVQLDTMLDLCKKHVNNIPASLSTHRSIQGLQVLFND